MELFNLKLCPKVFKEFRYDLRKFGFNIVGKPEGADVVVITQHSDACALGNVRGWLGLLNKIAKSPDVEIEVDTVEIAAEIRRLEDLITLLKRLEFHDAPGNSDPGVGYV